MINKSFGGNKEMINKSSGGLGWNNKTPVDNSSDLVGACLGWTTEKVVNKSFGGVGHPRNHSQTVW